MSSLNTQVFEVITNNINTVLNALNDNRINNDDYSQMIGKEKPQ